MAAELDPTLFGWTMSGGDRWANAYALLDEPLMPEGPAAGAPEACVGRGAGVSGRTGA